MGTGFFPLDSPDTTDVITLIAPDGHGVLYARRWQTPQGIMDLGEVIDAGNPTPVGHPARERGLWLMRGIMDYHQRRGALYEQTAQKMSRVSAAQRRDDWDTSHFILASLRPAEREAAKRMLADIMERRTLGAHDD